MRKNKLLLACVVVLCTFISSRVSAQSPVKFGIGIEGGIPTGSASDLYAVSAGASLNVLVPLPVTNLSVIGSAGYQQWFLKGDIKDAFKEEGYDVGNAGILPIRVGARYGIGPSPLYIKFDLGPAFSVKEVIKGGGDSGTAMSYSPGAGVKLGSFEAELKYDIYSKDGSLSFFGLKLSHYFN
ncbi:hypothetical protein GCM10023231_06410 [Olivibacter ginsenosidimutans]|uniref:Porin family protein n=1 Tax=Olivibacter ginsenosidimutans TaxID=1176537 RepID=A0ABP9AJ42_9SPHI